ncbi:MAG TPA: CPBP family intramembrane glutamate endopeptidase, partial [Amycolatopsis sp.]|nr:CPBP family intramembrane glutamate endopeptidase [Amycolatopsis sp.]
MTVSQPREPIPEAAPPDELAAGGEVAALDTPPSHRWGFGAFLLVEAVLLASAAFISV